MKNITRYFISKYFNNAWIPSILSLIITISNALILIIGWKPPTIISDVLNLLFTISVIGALSALLWHFMKKHWLKGIISFYLLLIALSVAFAFFIHFSISSITINDIDGFADKLIIPDNIEISDPLEESEKSNIKNDKPSIELRKSFQPGIYDSAIRVNPGEPGRIYLKAYEITKNYPLSADILKEKSNKQIGWSENPSEIFLSDTHFKIYEGDWEKPYAARFEVWFIPYSGSPEQKLLERNFKIEGWTR